MRYALCLLLCTSALAQTATQRTSQKNPDLTPEQVAELENVVANQPSNETARARLLEHYFQVIRRERAKTPEQVRQARGRHVRWLIEDTPRSALLSRHESFAMSGYLEDSANYEMARELWLRQTDRFPYDESVIRNAVLLLQQRDRLQALHLMKRCYELSAASQNDAHTFGTQLGLAVLGTGGDEIALHDGALHLLGMISDPRVLATAGGTIVNYTRNRPGIATDGETEALARKLLTDVMTNSNNARLIRYCQIEIEHLDGKGRFSANPGEVPEIVTIGSALRLRVEHSVDAEIGPSASMPAKVTVNVLVGTDGNILEATAFGSNAAVNKAAEAAVRSWLFRPTLLYGHPVKARGVVVVQVRPTAPE